MVRSFGSESTCSRLRTTVGAPANSALFELRPDGTFDYTHDGGNTTADSFTYQADDGDNLSNVATVSITINPINDRPVITLLGPAIVNLVAGDAFTDDGATAADEEDRRCLDGIEKEALY